MVGHIIPDTNAAYDLGSAEYKIRHLYLSDNTLYVSDQHKLQVDVNGELKFRKRSSYGTLMDNMDGASTIIEAYNTAHNANVSSLSQMKLDDIISIASQHSLSLPSSLLDGSGNLNPTVRESLLEDNDNFEDNTAIGGSSSSSGSGSSSTINNRGQTFFDILTQQPEKFTHVSTESDSGSITINWNYDDILPSITNSSERALLNLYSSGKNRYLPNMNSVKFDLSHNSLEAGWHNHSAFTKSVGNNDYNNGTTYKTITINKGTSSATNTIAGLLSSTEVFDIRIYGENDSGDFPTKDSRALVLTNVSFQAAQVPSDPVLIDNTASANEITIDYNVAQIERGKTSSNGNLLGSVAKYQLNDSYSYYHDSLSTDVLNDTEESESSKSGYFNTVLSTLYYGANYNFLTKVRNNLKTDEYNIPDASWSNTYFDANKLGPSVYTDLPAFNRDYGNAPATTSLDYTRSHTGSRTDFYVSGLVKGNSNDQNDYKNSNTHIYMNKNFGNAKATGSGRFQFEVSNRDINDDDLNDTNPPTSGIGKFLADASNVVVVKASVKPPGSTSFIEKQRVSYHGFNSGFYSNNSYNHLLKPDSSGSTIFFLHQKNNNNDFIYWDPYRNDEKQRGFRIFGRFFLNSLDKDDVQSAFGDASSNPYELKIDFNRDSTLTKSGSATKTTYFYVDNLSGLPVRESATNTPVVKTVKYCMGIPSVEKFNIECTRKYTNINSPNKYIRGDKVLSYIGGIANVSGDSAIYHKISTIDASGIYELGVSDITNFYSTSGKCYHTNSRTGTSGFNLSFTEYVYSMEGASDKITNTVECNHFVDYTSFTNNSGTFTPNLDLSQGDIMQLTATSNMSSDLRNIGLVSYTDHAAVVADHTLLYYQGKFRAPSDLSYPNPLNYTWNDNTVNDYTAADKGTDIDGAVVTDGTGYKWIAFRFMKVTEGSATKLQHNGVNYTINSSKLELQTILNGYFETSIVTDLFDSDNTDVIGFAKVDYNTSQGVNTHIGSLQSRYVGGDTDYSVGGYVATSLENSTVGTYGARKGTTDSYGLHVDIALVDSTYLYVYVGIKPPSN